MENTTNDNIELDMKIYSKKEVDDMLIKINDANLENFHNYHARIEKLIDKTYKHSLIGGFCLGVVITNIFYIIINLIIK